MVIAENTMEQRLIEAEAAAERLRRECAESATKIVDLEARLAERAICPGTQAVDELTRMREEQRRGLAALAAREAHVVRVEAPGEVVSVEVRPAGHGARCTCNRREETCAHCVDRRAAGSRCVDTCGPWGGPALCYWCGEACTTARCTTCGGEQPGRAHASEVRRAEQEAAHLRAKLATAEAELGQLRADLDDVNNEADALINEGLSKVDAADLEDLRALATQVVEAWDRSDREKMIQAVSMLREISDADDPPEPPEMFQARPPRPLPKVSTGEHVVRYVEAMRGSDV